MGCRLAVYQFQDLRLRLTSWPKQKLNRCQLLQKCLFRCRLQDNFHTDLCQFVPCRLVAQSHIVVVLHLVDGCRLGDFDLFDLSGDHYPGQLYHLICNIQHDPVPPTLLLPVCHRSQILLTHQLI